MANTLSSFLVSIGLDFDESGAKHATNSIDSIKRTALQAGAAVAGAFGAKAITSDIANRTNMYRQQAEVIGTTTQSLDALTRVYEREGGNAQALYGQLESIKKLRAGLLTGNTDWIPQSVIAGLDTSAIMNAADPTKAYQEIIKQMSKMSVEQRLNVANALGLDSKSINLAIKGADYLQSQVAKALDRRPLINELQGMSEQYTKGWSDLWDNIAGITDRAGVKIIPKVNEITGSMNEFFNTHRKDIDNIADKGFGFIADNLDSVAVAIGSLSAMKAGSVLGILSKHLPIIGGTAGKLGMVAKNLGAVGAAIAGANLAAKGIDEIGQNFEGYRDADAWFTKKLYEYTGIDFSRGNVYTDTQPTVVTPDQAASLSTPPSYMLPGGNTLQSGYPANMQQQTSRPIVLNATVKIGNKEIRDAVIEVNEEQDSQAIKDFKSPVNR